MARRDLTMNDDDMGLTCLEIMARGEDLLSIGVWEAPIKRLAMKELAVKVGNGYRITDKGREALAKAEGVEIEAVAAMAPPMPDWIVTPIPEGLVVLRKNEMTVSGYEAMSARWVPIVHGQKNEIDTLAIVGEPDGFLQAMLDAAWKRGLRPSDDTA